VSLSPLLSFESLRVLFNICGGIEGAVNKSKMVITILIVVIEQL
jgi:hypothetical protein